MPIKSYKTVSILLRQLPEIFFAQRVIPWPIMLPKSNIFLLGLCSFLASVYVSSNPAANKECQDTEDGSDWEARLDNNNNPTYCVQKTISTHCFKITRTQALVYGWYGSSSSKDDLVPWFTFALARTVSGNAQSTPSPFIIIDISRGPAVYEIMSGKWREARAWSSWAYYLKIC